MIDTRLKEDAVLRVGEVTSVEGRRILITVDKDKNLSELFFDGDILRNTSVGSYIEIQKGFLGLIGKVDGENSQLEFGSARQRYRDLTGQRVLTVSLVGYLDRSGKFYGGTKELPLVGNEAFLLTKDKTHQVHNLVADDDVALNIATSEYEGYDIALPVDGLMNSHIAVFGNTGSGKSNTLAILYESFISKMRDRNAAAFDANCRVLLFDFNGEYSAEECITRHKHTYKLSTRTDAGDKLPLPDNGLLDIEMLSILSDATEKTQKPFLKRALKQHTRVNEGENPLEHTRNILRRQITKILQMSDKIRADLLMDYLRRILPEYDQNGEIIEIAADLDWNNTLKEFTKIGLGNAGFLKSNPAQIPNTTVYQLVDDFEFDGDVISNFVTFCYIQLIYDVLSNRAQNDHIAPVINKLRGKQDDIRKLFVTNGNGDLFSSNVVIVDLHDVNLEMKKTIPLLLSRKVYHDHKQTGDGKTLSIIIDEAHNILSRESFRESESWKDYRLETFEEIIKEGRKFGVFVTIASQRPNDISATVTSQAHNYFIHRLINQRDLQSIASAVSYIDKITEESIPTLPTGTCVFSGVAGQMPLKLSIKKLDTLRQPKSTTRQFGDIVPET